MNRFGLSSCFSSDFSSCCDPLRPITLSRSSFGARSGTMPLPICSNNSQHDVHLAEKDESNDAGLILTAMGSGELGDKLAQLCQLEMDASASSSGSDAGRQPLLPTNLPFRGLG